MPALRTRDTQSRPLEVTTDAPAAPSLHIVSPTPRAFTFPISHNLSDSPYASPSSSPFEPDLRSLPHPCTLSSSSSSSMTATPPPHPYAILRADSPFARAPSPPTPAHTTHKRRKSSCSSDVVERRPKKGDEDYIKRPENAFILFRRKCCEDRQQAQEEAAANADATGAGPTKKQRQADLSKTISQQWKSLSPEERQFWEQLAKDKKKEHESKYPNYVYRPQRAKDKDGKTKSNNTSKKASSTASAAAASAAAAHAQAQAEAASKAMGYDESDSVSFVVPVSRPHGRSASAPTPPPYQSIQIPNVYHLTPSCPTSPSLLPMISRRSAHPGHPEDTFDFVATNQSAYLPSSYPMAGQFEASLQSSEFLRSMFNNPNTTANGHRNSEPATHLQHLNMSQQPDTLLLPAHPIVSPASSIGSGSSGPSSPSSGPYTPTSALLSSSSSSSASSWHHMPSSMGACDTTSLEAQAQAEMDLQTEMQMQQEYAAFAWGGGPNALWGTGEPAVLMGDDFDINAIPPIELGVPKYTENLAMGAPDGSGLEFGQDFVHALDAGSQYHHHENQGMSGLLFDDMMAGHGF